MYLFLICFLFSTLAVSDQLISCNDGDTCRIKTGNLVRKVRLSGIDAPEAGQPRWESSRDYLVSLLKGKELLLKCDGTSFDRAACRIFVKAVDVNEEMVKAGWAWDYPQFSQNRYKKSEEDARLKKIGLWQDAKSKSPFCYRHETNKRCTQLNNLYQP